MRHDVTRGGEFTVADTPIPATWAEAAPNLRLRIRAPQFEAVTSFIAKSGEPVDMVPGQLLGERVSVHLVYDQPKSIASLSPSHLQAWGVSEAEARAQAVKNLRQSAPAPFTEISPGLYTSRIGDDYDSARMMLVDELAALPMKGRVVAAPLSRHHVYFSGEDDPVALHAMLTTVQQSFQLPTIDNVGPLVLDNGSWQNWLPPTTHPDHRAWRELAMQDLGTSYAETKRTLEAFNANNGIDLYIASFGGIQLPDGMFSMAAWPPVRGLLPRTDYVAIFRSEDPDDGFVLAPWSAVEPLRARCSSPWVPGPSTTPSTASPKLP